MFADLAGGHADRSIRRRMRGYTRPLEFIIDELVSGRAVAGEHAVLNTIRSLASSEHIAQFSG